MSRGGDSVPRIVVVTRKTDLELLVHRHGTMGQARFFLETRGQKIEELERRHSLFESALHQVIAAIPLSWRRTRIDRTDLDRFVFEPQDVIVAIGQDGLVANVAKYLGGQRVIGINPDADRYDGILVPHAPSRIGALLVAALQPTAEIEARTMVEAALDDGQRLLAVNELFVGHQTHQSARYRISWNGAEERQSSSGVIITTGTGSTGWARSIHLHRVTDVVLPAPCDPSVAFFVREAFPSRATATSLTDGVMAAGQELLIVSEMNERGVVFGDGIEEDRIDFGWGMGCARAGGRGAAHAVEGLTRFALARFEALTARP